jgi:hypothetical protein
MAFVSYTTTPGGTMNTPVRRILTALSLIPVLSLFSPSDLAGSAYAQTPLATRITAVTVYCDRAMITRTGKTAIPSGVRQVVISGLPPILQDQSVRVAATGTASAKILEVKVDRMYLDTLATARVKPLLQKSRSMNIDMRKTADRLALLKHQSDFLEKIGISSQESIAHELKTSRPTPEDYKKLLTFFDTELTSVKAETRSLEDQRLELQQAYERIQQEIRDIGGSPEKSEKQITVLFDVSNGGQLNIDATYLVSQANWTPVYDIRVASADTTVGLTYAAFVQQNTGEDWKDASITLTTSRPSLGGTPPELHPWYVGAADHARSMIEGVVRDADTGEPLPGVNVTVMGTNFGGSTDANGYYRLLNIQPGAIALRASYIGYQSIRTSVFTRPFATTTCDIAMRPSSVETMETVVVADMPAVQKNATSAIRVGRAEEVNAPAPAAAPIEVQTATVTSTATAASFEIPGESTIPSDNADHRVTVMIARLGGGFSHSAVPKLQPDVYFKARLKNSTEFPILPGAVSVYLDNSFISTSKLPAVLPGESFDAYLGIDNGVRVERKLVNRLNETSGIFSRIRKTTYDILIIAENRKKRMETVSVQENIPVSQDERVKVTILMPKPEEAVPDNNGIITWKIALAPGERREIRLQYAVESPVDLSIGGLD